ncbi:UPF0161 protein At3g09310 [Cornus florida]|uniref:UPF0161 protein At3g09310 n=1 Tax=Cornus florida TaxID=4283 RepID=UPI00289CBC89|nr:UPF0161 protein At3g09310 [Cornus florida]XP_059647079.1 UPF0161 protein At3g09310 [Cornus florida]XP_059647080.1 UPF0161 protein At3g09310 [Cornus florida]
MALALSSSNTPTFFHQSHTSLSIVTQFTNPNSLSFRTNLNQRSIFFPSINTQFHNRRRRLYPIVNGLDEESEQKALQEDEADNLGVKAALSMLRFYKREISPVLQNSCRYVPTCSEYSMIAYKKYGFAKGTILTAWRICRCNPLGGSGFDPPRWFGETTPPDQ